MSEPGGERRYQWIADESAAGRRLDQWLAEQLGAGASRARIQRWIEAGAVRSGEPLAKSHRVEAGRVYALIAPKPEPQRLEAVDLGLETVFEDEHLAVIRKPPGLAVHPGPGDRRVSIAHGLLHLWGPGLLANDSSAADAPVASEDPADGNADPAGAETDETAFGGPGADPLAHLRPGIVHRLDRDTEGLLAVAKHPRSVTLLSREFAERRVRKHYTAWLVGAPRESQGRVEAAIARHRTERRRMRVDPRGRPAVTEYRVENWIASKRGRKYAKVDVDLLTGRTHQIRVHMAHLGCPVVGDELYSRSAKEFQKFGLLLFARRLAFQHPFTGEYLDFELEPPERFREFEAKASQY